MLKGIWKLSDNCLSEVEDKHVVDAISIVDKHLAEVLNATPEGTDWKASLNPYDDDGESIHTYYSFLRSFLTCTQLVAFAQKRVDAIKEGKGFHQMMQAVVDGEDTAGGMKAKLDAQIEDAKSAGLNFNAVAKLFLYDVGVLEPRAPSRRRRTNASKDGKKSAMIINVPKFLNRCLGMPLHRQSMLTNHLVKCLDKRVR